MSENKDTVKQNVFLRDKKEITITGVYTVDSFDEFKISATNSDGTVINVEGDSLSIKEVNLETGTIEAVGNIICFFYENRPKSNKTGILRQIFYR